MIGLITMVALVALLSVRPLAALRGLNLGAARTGRQLWTAVRGTGWARCAGRAVWAVTVVVLLVLASVGAGTGRAVYTVAHGIWLVGIGLAEVVPAPEVRA